MFNPSLKPSVPVGLFLVGFGFQGRIYVYAICRLCGVFFLCVGVCVRVQVYVCVCVCAYTCSCMWLGLCVYLIYYGSLETKSFFIMLHLNI